MKNLFIIFTPILLASPLSAADRSNVLFVAVDDLRPEFGCFGNKIVKTPNIDRLAARGTVFSKAYCQQAVCSPSRTSILTGLRPDVTKVWDLETHFRVAQPDEFLDVYPTRRSNDDRQETSYCARCTPCDASDSNACFR